MKNDAPFLTYLILYEVTVAATVNVLAPYCNTQAFMQAPLSTAVFPQRFSFFTVYWRPKRSLFEFKSVDRCKMHFSWIFFFNLRVSLRAVKKSLLERHLRKSFNAF